VQYAYKLVLSLVAQVNCYHPITHVSFVFSKQTHSGHTKDCLAAVWSKFNKTCHFISNLEFKVTQYNHKCKNTLCSMLSMQSRVLENLFLKMNSKHPLFLDDINYFGQ